MAFDGVFLRQVVRQLEPIKGARINKIYQISDTEVLFILKDHEKTQLMVSCHSSYNRIHLTNRQYPTRNTPSNFIMVMRKYLEGGTIADIQQAGLDRYLVITVSNRNEIGDRIKLEVYVELMGKYANIILVYNNRILEALKRIPPFENNRRTVQPGAEFKETESQSGKIDPFELTEAPSEENLFNLLTGFSPLLSREFTYRMRSGEKYIDIIREIDASDQIYIYHQKDEDLFHCIPLKHLGSEPEVMEICAGLDHIYYAREERERIRQQTGDLFKFTRREIKKYETKITKLNAALDEALNCDIWRQYGDALYANMDSVHKGMTQVTLKDWDGNSLDIKLDPKLDARGNARKCFQKYRKGATGQAYITEQLNQAKDNLNYFTVLQQQLEQSDFVTAGEIRQELENNGFLKARKNIRKSKKPAEPHYLKIPFNEKYIYVGRNNIQNDYVTFHKAGRADTWFHVKDMHGAHVIITTSHPDEQEIRTCAQLAAWYSRGRESSSIPVNYTLVKNLKKIPGTKTGMVSMKEYNTIYIDIDEKTVRELTGQDQ